MLPVVLTIAGSDSGGGAGIQADLKTFQALGCFGTSAITAITCQNTVGVRAVQGVQPEIVAGQIQAVLEDFPVKAIKTGMLYSADIIRTVVDCLKDSQIPLIVDPVMVATSGDLLLQKDALEEMKQLLKLATLMTPNMPEASVLMDLEFSTLEEMRSVVMELQDIYGCSVLLKGGHRIRDPRRPTEAVDLYFDGEVMEEFTAPVQDTKNTHGTGCTLSSAIVSHLAAGKDMVESIRLAKEYLNGAIRQAPGLGNGHGPLHHGWNLKI